MPDLNELLAWATANTAQPEATQADQTDGQLSLRFNPTTTPSSGSSALHPSDPGHPTSGPQALAPSDSDSAGQSSTRAKREDLTSEMLDFIMGKSDSIIMKEKMAVAMDTSKSIDERVQALDDFEMLIELIDNANNMAILKLWEPLLKLLQDEHQPVVAHACWIMGTAVQNNLKAQSALYTFNALPAILSTIYPSSSSSKPYTSTRAKATYALSSALKHWPLAAGALASNNGQGHSVLSKGVGDAEPVIRRKMAFLIGTLTMQSGETYEGDIPGEVRNLVEADEKTAGVKESVVEGLKREGVYSALLKGLTESDVDVEYEENAIRALSKAAQKDGLSGDEKKQVKDLWASWGKSGQADRGLEGEDAAEIAKAFA